MASHQPVLDKVLHLLGERTGLSFPANRRDSARLGIRRAMKRAGVTDLEAYFGELQNDPRVFDDLVVELTVGETYFFREPAQFEFLRRQAIPEVLQQRGREHRLRVWSAGCASGEEPYSLAILFHQLGLGAQVHILATDVSRAALGKALRAVYGKWSLRGEAEAAVRPYLEPQDGSFVLVDKIRRRVTFDYLNLALDVYPSFATGVWGMDVILCRNVLIYFDPETTRRVARRFFETLAPGGWMITASSDPPLTEFAPFQPVVVSQGVFYRRPEAGSPTDTRPGHKTGVLACPVEGTGEDACPTNAKPHHRAPRRTHAPRVARPSRPSPSDQDPLEQARETLARGDYARAAELAGQNPDDPAAAALHVRALANLDTARAEHACAEAVTRHPLSVELRYLRALLLIELGHDREAARAVRRVIYLDRSLAIAHFTLGALLRRQGDRAGAQRAFRNVIKLCAERPAEEVVPFSDGEHAGRLAEAGRSELAILEAAQETSS
ncbi:MAG: chemotaxis protein CheR [Planctomycetes bacterium]|nr:chemotaxis protein CheR [Planctomycetota bacterium]